MPSSLPPAQLRGYAWVSTPAPSLLALQVEHLHQAGCHEVVQELAPARQPRPLRQQLWQRLRPGETLVVWQFDRLASSLPELVALLLDLYERRVYLRSLYDQVDTQFSDSLPLASLAAFQAALQQARTQAGRQAAHAQGRQGGRPPGLSPAAHATAQTVQQLAQHGKRAPEISRQLGISRATVYRYLARRDSVMPAVGSQQELTP